MVSALSPCCQEDLMVTEGSPRCPHGGRRTSQCQEDPQCQEGPTVSVLSLQCQEDLTVTEGSPRCPHGGGRTSR